jgi:hypothetical protein
VDLVVRVVSDEHAQLLAIAVVNLATAIFTYLKTRQVRHEVRLMRRTK